MLQDLGGVIQVGQNPTDRFQKPIFRRHFGAVGVNTAEQPYLRPPANHKTMSGVRLLGQTHAPPRQEPRDIRSSLSS